MDRRYLQREKYKEFLKTKNKELNQEKRLQKQKKRQEKDRRKLEAICLADRYARQHRLNPTPEESIMIDILIENRINFEFQKVFIKGCRFYIVDFYLETVKGKRYVIEIDGYHHRKSREKDQQRTNWIKRKFGIEKVIRFWNNKLQNEAEYVNRIIKAYDFKKI